MLITLNTALAKQRVVMVSYNAPEINSKIRNQLKRKSTHTQRKILAVLNVIKVSHYINDLTFLWHC